MIALERLFIDFELASLWQRSFVFGEIELDGPAVRVVSESDGTLSLSLWRSAFRRGSEVSWRSPRPSMWLARPGQEPQKDRHPFP